MAEAVKEEPADYDETAAPVVPEYVSIPDSFNEDEDSKCDINLGEISSTDTDEKVDIKHDSEYYQQFLDKEPWDAGEGTSKQPDGDVKPSGLVESIKEEFDSENSDMEDENGEDNEDSKSLFEEQLHDVKDADSDEDGEQSVRKSADMEWSKNISFTGTKSHKVSEERFYDCKFCGCFTTSIIDRNRHLDDVHSDLRIHKCKLCDHRAFDPLQLRWHVNRVHNKESKIHKCDSCPFTASTLTGILSHTRSIHSKHQEYECEICDFSTSDVVLLERHLQCANHNERHDDDANYQCELCEYSSQNQHGLEEHFADNHKKKIKCRKCKSIIANSATCAQHMVQCNAKSHKCNDCPYEAYTSYELKRHIRRRHNEHYLCNYCDFKTNTKSQHVKHKREVHHIRRHKCDFCDYSTDGRAQFLCHIDSKHPTCKTDS